MNPSGKVMVVTGAGSGMGRQVALELLRRGAKVAAVDMNGATLAETVTLAGPGAAISTHIADVYPVTGLTTACWIESGGVRYDVTGISDAAGAGHHLALDLVAVT